MKLKKLMSASLSLLWAFLRTCRYLLLTEFWSEYRCGGLYNLISPLPQALEFSCVHLYSVTRNTSETSE